MVKKRIRQRKLNTYKKECWNSWILIKNKEYWNLRKLISSQILRKIKWIYLITRIIKLINWRKISFEIK